MFYETNAIANVKMPSNFKVFCKLKNTLWNKFHETILTYITKHVIFILSHEKNRNDVFERETHYY